MIGEITKQIPGAQFDVLNQNSNAYSSLTDQVTVKWGKNKMINGHWSSFLVMRPWEMMGTAVKLEYTAIRFATPANYWTIKKKKKPIFCQTFLPSTSSS